MIFVLKHFALVVFLMQLADSVNLFHRHRSVVEIVTT